MQEHTKQALYLYWLGRQAATQQAVPLKSSKRMLSIASNEGNNRGSPYSRFIIKAKQDKNLADPWMNRLLPSLPKILDEYFGLKYTVNLIRQGTSRSNNHPVIEVRCVPGQNCIEQKIFDANHRPRIPLQFSCSSSKPLANTSSEEENIYEDHQKHARFSFQRPWNTPGMGASIGLFVQIEFPQHWVVMC